MPYQGSAKNTVCSAHALITSPPADRAGGSSFSCSRAASASLKVCFRSRAKRWPDFGLQYGTILAAGADSGYPRRKSNASCRDAFSATRTHQKLRPPGGFAAAGMAGIWMICPASTRSGSSICGLARMIDRKLRAE